MKRVIPWLLAGAVVVGMICVQVWRGEAGKPIPTRPSLVSELLDAKVKRDLRRHKTKEELQKHHPFWYGEPEEEPGP